MLTTPLADTRLTRGSPACPGPVIPPSKVIIVDNRTGDLWAWSEVEQTVLYLGYIFPLAGQGPFARVINVPEQR